MPVKIMIPVVFFVLPCLLIVVMGPAIISVSGRSNAACQVGRCRQIRALHQWRSGHRTLGARPDRRLHPARPVILSTILIAAIWVTATFASSITGLQLMPALVVESSLVGVLVTLSLNQSYLLIPALVIPQFVAGIHRGTRGAFESLGAELVVLTAAIGSNVAIVASTELLATLFTWLFAGLGFGLIGAVIRSAKLALGDTTRSSYRDARALLTELLELSDDLVEGLDPISIGQHIVSVAREEIPLSGVLVHARTPGGASPS